MIIGIDASRAAKLERTGVEEYVYQNISELAKLETSHQFRLYSNKSLPEKLTQNLPNNFKVFVMPFFRLWTQVRLSWEMLWRAPDILWIPATAIPIIHPQKTIVTIHGLEFKYFPEAYSVKQRKYLDFSTRKSVDKAWKIIAVSESTKRDLVKFYQADSQKITVIHNGYGKHKAAQNWQEILNKYKLEDQKYFIFYGRLESRKNLVRLIKAFEKYGQGKLLLVGKPGTGFEEIKKAADQNKNVILPGYVEYPELFALLQHAKSLTFPTLYEGFGIPVLDAYALGTPVVCSKTSSLPEVSGGIGILVDPLSIDSIADGLRQTDKIDRENFGFEARKQVQNFGWEKAARGFLDLLKA